MPYPEPENLSPVEPDPGSTIGSPLAEATIASSTEQKLIPDEFLGFQLTRTAAVQDLEATGIFYRHEKLGLEVLFLKNQDSLKGIYIEFVTPSRDSSGVAHIVEHDRFRGSTQLPSQDPVNEYERGSLCYDSNAETRADSTRYYAASRHDLDFANLRELLLSSCFHALHRPVTFKQEARRIEIDPESLAREKRFNGTVLSEMWDWHCNPDECHESVLAKELFAGTPYQFNSGGDPLEILGLTHQAMLEYAKTHYVPANCRIAFSGDCNITECLAAIFESIEHLESGERAPLSFEGSEIPAPFRKEAVYPGAENEDRRQDSYLTLNWKLAPSNDPLLNMKLSLLNELLLGDDVGALRLILEESDLGESVFDQGFEADLPWSTFTVGVTGAAASDLEKLEQTILTTLEKVVKEGFAQNAILTTIDAFKAEQADDMNSPSRAFDALPLALDGWLRGCDPIACISELELIGAIERELIENPRLFEELVQRFFIENNQRVSIALRPDRKLLANWRNAQEKVLSDYLQQLGPEGIERELQETQELSSKVLKADTQRALDRIPRLNVSHMRHKATIEPPLELTDFPGVSLSERCTHSVAYFNLAFDLRSISFDLVPYAVLFGECVLTTGLRSESARIQSLFDFDIKPIALRSYADGAIKPFLLMSGAGFKPHLSHGLANLGEILTASPIDSRSFVSRVLNAKLSELQGALRFNEAEFAELRAEGLLSGVAMMRDRLRGLGLLSAFKSMEREIRTGGWTEIREKLQEVQQLITTSGDHKAHVVCDPNDAQQIAPGLHSIVTRYGGPVLSPGYSFAACESAMGIVVPNMVNNLGMAIPLRAPNCRQLGSDAVITWHITKSILWEQIRKRGGAYLSMAMLSSNEPTITLFSSSDPNILQTVEIFRSLPALVRELSSEDTEVRQSIIKCIGDMDKVESMAQFGRQTFYQLLEGEPFSNQQRYRDEILGTSAEDYHRFAAELEQGVPNARTVVIGSRNRLELVREALQIGTLQVP